MALFEIHDDSVIPVAASTFVAVNMRERDDIQRILRSNIDMLDGGDGIDEPSLMVLAEEYGQWDGAGRRIDLLCLDRQANLVVVEIKRTEDGGHMELQALRYAAMVSAMTFDRAVEAHGRFLAATDGGSDTQGGDGNTAEASILTFLGWDEPDEDAFGNDVAIVLVAAGFSTEITTCVLWLGERGIDIRCVRLTPHKRGDTVLLDVRQIVPLPEAADYQIQFREKATAKRKSRSRNADYTKYDLALNGTTRERLAKRWLIYHTVAACIAEGISPETIAEDLPGGMRQWLISPGEHDEVSFAGQVATMRTARGARYNMKKWFAGDDELFHIDGKTFAFRNQWRLKAPIAARTLANKYLAGRCTITESDA